MNIEAYISSGILELYVLGDLSPEEMQEVEQYAAKNPEVKRALAAIEQEMMAMDLALAESVDPSVKNNLFAQITADSTTFDQESTQETSDEDKSSSSRWLMAASVSLLALASIAAVYFYTQWQEVESNYQQLASQNQMLADNVKEARRSVNQLESELAIVTSEQTLEIALAGLPLQPEASAFIYFQPDKQAVYLKVASLLDPGQLNDYQLWAIVDGKPVDIGIINLQEAGLLQRMKSVTNASAFAVTLEPKGGSENPTLDQMVVLGEVKV